MKIVSTSLSLFKILNYCFNYVINTSDLYKIDESHAVKHSMDVYKFAKNIFDNELLKNPSIKKYESIIFSAAIGHDMCDGKYVKEDESIKKYKDYLCELMNENDLEIMGKIINTMSYSKVKKNGFPNLGEYQIAYHIVREADLLAGYDIDRCIIYKMYRDKCNYTDALEESLELFNKRVLLMRDDNLFITDY